MAINYASKYSQVVDEKFKLGMLTGAMTSNEYDWVGVETVTVYSIPTVSMGDYSLTGSTRYGTAGELQNSKQDLKVEKDRAFTFTIDRKSYDDTMMTMEAGKALQRQIDEVVIPEIDTYRLASLVSNAGNADTHATKVSKTDAYATFLKVNEMLDEDKIPTVGRICYCTPAFYNLIKQDDAFIKKGDLSQEMLAKGFIGECDGVGFVKVPSSYFPAKTNFVITLAGIHPSPIKLAEYKIHEDAPGISGWLIEGRVRYDSFVLTNKANAVGVSKNTNA